VSEIASQSQTAMSLVFNVRVQSQVTDANLGTKGLNALMGVLDRVSSASLEVALLGDGSGAHCIVNMDITVVGIRSAPVRAQLAAMVAWARNAVKSSKAARLLPPTMYGVPTIDLLAAVFLYTAENPYPLYSCITTPLNVSGTRTLQSLQNQLLFMKLFTLGLRCLPISSSYRFKGALYRGIDISKNSAFKIKYDSHATSYQVGTTITFVAPTSFSTSDQVAGAFTKGIQFVAPDGEGVNLDDLSAFDEESEVVVDGPSTWEVVASTMTPTGTLVVVIKRMPDFITFLTHFDDAIPAAPPVAAAASSAVIAASCVPAASSGSSLASLSSSDVAALVGIRGPAYVAYAPQFEKNGIDGTVIQNSSIEELIEIMSDMGISTVHKLALKAAMIQWKQQPQAAVDTLVQASKQPALASASLAQDKLILSIGSTSIALDAAACDVAQIYPLNLKKAGFKFSDVRTLGYDLPKMKQQGFTAAEFKANQCDLPTLKLLGFTVKDLRDASFAFPDVRALGFDLPALKAGGFEATAFRAAGCGEWAALKNLGFTAAEIVAAGCDLATVAALGYEASTLYKSGFNALVLAGFNISNFTKASRSLLTRYTCTRAIHMLVEYSHTRICLITQTIACPKLTLEFSCATTIAHQLLFVMLPSDM
jgi:hypothetical protein